MVISNKQNQKDLIELNDLNQSFELIDLNIIGNELLLNTGVLVGNKNNKKI